MYNVNFVISCFTNEHSKLDEINELINYLMQLRRRTDVLDKESASKTQSEKKWWNKTLDEENVIHHRLWKVLSNFPHR